MNFKKAFTLAEILIVIVIISLIALVMIKTLKPESYAKKANIANGQKAIATFEKAFSQILDMEENLCPLKAFMVKPAGITNWEYACTTSLDSSEEFRNKLKDYIKYDKTDNFCNMSGYCSGEETFKGIRLPGGIVAGVKTLDVDTNITNNCAAYRTPGQDSQIPAPTRFNKVSGAIETSKCWGQLWIDVNGNEIPNTLGEDVFIFNLGESGLER